jgi:hypothetical protein
VRIFLNKWDEKLKTLIDLMNGQLGSTSMPPESNRDCHPTDPDFKKKRL